MFMRRISACARHLPGPDQTLAVQGFDRLLGKVCKTRSRAFADAPSPAPIRTRLRQIKRLARLICGEPSVARGN